MAAIMGRTEVGIKRIGGSVVVADNPKAKLMYYLDCICSVLDLSDTDNLSRLRFVCLFDKPRIMVQHHKK